MADGDAPVDVVGVDSWVVLAVDMTGVEVTTGSGVTMAADFVAGSDGTTGLEGMMAADVVVTGVVTAGVVTAGVVVAGVVTAGVVTGDVTAGSGVTMAVDVVAGSGNVTDLVVPIR